MRLSCMSACILFQVKSLKLCTKTWAEVKCLLSELSESNSFWTKIVHFLTWLINVRWCLLQWVYSHITWWRIMIKSKRKFQFQFKIDLYTEEPLFCGIRETKTRRENNAFWFWSIIRNYYILFYLIYRQYWLCQHI